MAISVRSRPLNTLRAKKQFANQRALNALPQEHLLVIVEGLLAKQAVIGCGEAAPRYRADAVDFIKQADPSAVGRDLRVTEFLRDPIGKYGGPGAAARKSQEMR